MAAPVKHQHPGPKSTHKQQSKTHVPHHLPGTTATLNVVPPPKVKRTEKGKS